MTTKKPTKKTQKRTTPAARVEAAKNSSSKKEAIMGLRLAWATTNAMVKALPKEHAKIALFQLAAIEDMAAALKGA